MESKGKVTILYTTTFISCSVASLLFTASSCPTAILDKSLRPTKIFLTKSTIFISKVIESKSNTYKTTDWLKIR